MTDSTQRVISKPNTGEYLVEEVHIVYRDGSKVVVDVHDTALLFDAVKVEKPVANDSGEDRVVHHGIVMRWAELIERKCGKPTVPEETKNED